MSNKPSHYAHYKLSKKPQFEYIKIKSVYEDADGIIEDYDKEDAERDDPPDVLYGVYGIDFHGDHEHIADFATLEDAKEFAAKLGADIK